MEDTFDDLGKSKNHGMPDLNKRRLIKLQIKRFIKKDIFQ